MDQWDTEELATLNADAVLPAFSGQASNEDASSNQRPMLTRTWYHTGFFFNAASITTALQSEYYREGDAATGVPGVSGAEAQALFLPDTVLPVTILQADGSRIPYDLTGEEMREACRALRGSRPRQEVYGFDDTAAQDRPYSTNECCYGIEMLQPQGPNPYGALLDPRESLKLDYERQLVLLRMARSPTLPHRRPAPFSPQTRARPTHSRSLSMVTEIRSRSSPWLMGGASPIRC